MSEFYFYMQRVNWAQVGISNSTWQVYEEVFWPKYNCKNHAGWILIKTCEQCCLSNI